MNSRAHVGVTGLAVMGRNLARNLARHGYAVAVHNRTAQRTRDLVADYGDEGTFIPVESAKDMVAALSRPRRLIVMVQAGRATDDVIAEYATLLEPGDVIVDGGNAHFADTRRREAALRRSGIHFLGTGISGGEEGALNGPSIMPGGSSHAYGLLAPVLNDIAATTPDGTPAVAHLGPDGAGHFVKMVHNGIEYADMQLIAEAYHMIRHSTGYQPRRIAEIFREWNQGRLNSYLIEVTAEVLAHHDADTGLPFVDIVADAAEQKGTGRWTVQSALDLGVPVSGIAEAVFARSTSGHGALRAAGSALPGPVPTILGERDAARFIGHVEQALYASKVISYAQGMHQIQTASRTYAWNVDLAAVAAVWRAGCIIRASFLDRVRESYATRPDLPSLLADPAFAREIGAAQLPWRLVVAHATRDGVPVPAFAAALAHYDTLRTPRLPAALTQAQRDYFGAHTYRRNDRPGSYHTRWGLDRSEQATA
ncbi:phosphogluconate dehydrogenase (NADP(+)-dependent, decarboxylating) [Streptomyces sp. Ru62]|uniref:NADP-dependent phosphogluconate dehydrogenase n=1 Tax=Streptomyces sp. Ru62 TaxID=2080745 RepID=UPI000CDDF652|nr:NADP-dependent phosphogluconate dehydrogenase [Streptomyces sp. Ru62]POX63500.1 phosphogluconate dehydrogenase (NADP(+)-dependent, decarboxylating) [Streptomyces sp. Ru62]